MITRLIIQHKTGTDLLTLVNNIIRLLKVEEFICGKYEGDDADERLESIQAFKTFLRDNTLKSFLKFVYGSNKSKKKCTKEDIQLMSIHKSKGLEFKEVYIVGIEDEKFPNKKAPMDEEARLFYVAVTRPKENLTISEIGFDNLFADQYFEGGVANNEYETAKQAS